MPDRLTLTIREEKARVMSGLVRLLGNLDRAEDCFSEAVEAALKHWPVKGIPDNQGAWQIGRAHV